MALPCFLYDNRFSDNAASLTATDTAAFPAGMAGSYDVANIVDLRPYTAWLAASFGTKYISCDCLSAKAADTLAILGHNLGTASASVSVESSTTGVWGGEEVQRLAPFTPTSDKAILVKFSTATIRYWRLKIVTASVAPYLSVVMLGARLEMPYPPDAPYKPYSEGIVAMTELGKTGNYLGSTLRYFPITINPVFSHIDRTWATGTFQPFWDNWAKQLKPFFYAWDTDNFPTHVFYVWIDISQSGGGTGLFELPLTTSAFVDSLTLYLAGVMEV